MGTKGRGLYIAGAVGLGALLGAGCGVKVDPAEPMKDESTTYTVEGKDFKDYLGGLKESKEPVKGIKGIESLIGVPEEETSGIVEAAKFVNDTYINGPENTDKVDKPTKFHPWIR